MKKNCFLLIFLSLASFVTAQDLFPYLNGNAYGFCDAHGKVQIAPQYDEVGFFDKNGFANVRKDTLWSLIDKSGVVYLPFQSSKKYTTQPIPQRYESNDYLDITKMIKVSKNLAVAIANHKEFWLLDREKKQNLGLYRMQFYQNEKARPFYYHFDRDYYYSSPPTYIQNVLILVHQDSTMSALDTLGNVLIDQVKQLQILNDRFLSFPKGNLTVLYDQKTKKTLHLPYTTLAKTLNDTCFLVTNDKKATVYGGHSLHLYPNVDTIKIINQYNQVFFSEELEYLKAISPTHYLATGKESSSIRLKIVDGKAQRTTYQDRCVRMLKDNRLAIQVSKNKTQIMDYDGKVLFEGKYSDFLESSTKFEKEYYYRYSSGNQYGILDSNFKEVFRSNTGFLEKTSMKGYYTFEKKAQMGVVNQVGIIIIPAEYADIDVLDNNFFKVRVGSMQQDENKNIGVFSKEGKELVPPIYNNIYVEKDKDKTYFKSELNEKRACFDEQGKKISNSIKPQSIYYQGGSSIAVYYNEKTDSSTIYDKLGRRIDYFKGKVHTEKIIVRSDSSIFNLVRKGDWGEEQQSTLLDEDSKSVFASNQRLSNHIFAQYLIYGIFAIQENGKEAVFNHKKKQIIPFDKQVIHEINDQYIVVLRNGKVYFYTHQGALINSEGYDNYELGQGRKFRYVGINIPNKTQRERTMYDSLTTVPCQNYGVVNQYGKLVIPMIYNAKPDIAKQYICTSKGLVEGQRESYLLDTLGNVLLKTNHDQLKAIDDYYEKTIRYIEARKGDKFGLIDLNGKEIMKMKYNRVSSYWGNVLFKAKEGKIEKIINLKEEYIANMNEIPMQMYGNYSPTFVVKDKLYILRLKEKTHLINLNGEIVKTFETPAVRYMFEQNHYGVHKMYSNIEDDPNYPMRDLLEIKKDKQVWYYNLETLTEYKER
jgi:hypothetical protein